MTRAGYLLSEAYAEEERFDAVMEKGSGGGGKVAAAAGAGLGGAALYKLWKFAKRNMPKPGETGGLGSMAKEGGKKVMRHLEKN